MQINAKRILTGIVEGSPIPLFVIDKRHRIIYWNTAQEVLSGLKKEAMLGTNQQWRVFYAKKRPVLADLMVDKASFEEIKIYYGGKFQQSSLIKGAYEVEDFFSALGNKGKWLRLTVSPIRNNTGETVSAIETLEDITEHKWSTERLEHTNRVLNAIRKVNRLILVETGREKLTKDACENLVENRGYHNAWIALMDETGQLLSTAEAGLGKVFLPVAERLKTGRLIECSRRIMLSPQVTVIEDPLSVCGDCPLVGMYGGRGAMAARLEYHDKQYGILCASIPKDLIIDETETSLFSEMADDIAFALHSIEVEEERKNSEITLREQASELEVHADELHRSRERLVGIQEAVRKEIAQEIHGTVQNRLIVLLHRLGELEQVAGPDLATELNDLRVGLDELLKNHLRPISRRLFPSILRRGLIPALQSLGDQFEAILAIEIRIDKDLERLDRDNKHWITEQVRLAAYRIAEEALTNIVKHASADTVRIEAAFSLGGNISLTVKDNGQGFNKENVVSGVGLATMQDYAMVAGGTCIVDSSPGQGTKVVANLPTLGPDVEPEGRALP